MTAEEKIQEALKCGTDFLYWIMNYVWIEDKVAGGQTRFELWESQKRILPLFLAAVYLFILKARQLGLTWLTAALCLWMGIFRPNQLIVIISAKEDLAIKFLDRVKFMLDRLPTWMKPHVYKRTSQELHFGYEEKDRKGNTVVKGLNSCIQSLTTTPSGAQSMTVNLLVLDEASLIENIRKIWRSSKPGVDSAHGRILVISNPIKDGSGWPWFREQYVKAWRGLAGRIRHVFMPWWDHPDRPKNFIEIQRSEGYDDDDIAMHYPSTIEEAIEALTGNYFGKALAKHNQFTDGQKGYLEYDDDGDIRFEPSKHGILEVWEEPDQVGWRNLHVIFSDVSEGLGQTSSVAYVFNRDKRKFVAKLKSSKIAADLWADELIKLAKWCGDTPLLCPEVSGAGQTTLKVLRRERYPRIYRDRQEDKVRKKVTTTYGWAESRKKKVLLVDALKGYLRDSETPVPDGELIDQCSTFIRHPDGRLAKEDETKRDDCVIAAGGCLVLDETLPAPERTMTERDIVIATSLSVTKIPWANQEGSRDPWVE